MEDSSNYIIDEFKINDVICDLHDIPRSYNKYCDTCHKNLCNWCNGHNGHNLIDFTSLDPGPEVYKSYEEKLNKMSSLNEDFFKKALSHFEKRREEIKKMLDNIDIVISDINKTASLFQKELKFNETIINAYKKNKINYYVLNKYKNLNFNIDMAYYKKKWDINIFTFQEYKKKINFKKVSKSFLKSHLSIFSKILNSGRNSQNEEGFTNMWISDKYCKNWGIKEAIRELIQNQYDGIITKILTKNNLKVIKVGNKENINGSKIYLNFDFMNKLDDKIYGRIRYDESNNNLTISNEGLLWLGDFLLGGTKDESKNSDLIGTFGEGMKLAILALCRINKNVTIISSNKKYSFKIKEDQIFLKDNQPQNCLHFRNEEFENNDLDNIKVIINNISKEEWGNQIINFLWLLDDNVEIYTSYDKSYEEVEEVGQILREKYLRGKIYVKGIFVQDIKTKNKENKADCIGFNVDLKLDRDRNTIVDHYDFKEKTSKILALFCNSNIAKLNIKKKEKEENNKNKENKRPQSCAKIRKENNILEDNSTSNQEIKKEIDYETIFVDIINSIKDDDIDIISGWKISNSLSQESIECIWDIIYLNQDKKKNPVKDENFINNFINNRKLPKDFYPFFKVNSNLMYILEKSKNYISINKKFSNYVSNVIIVEPKGKYKKALEEIFNNVKKMKNEFDGKSVVFKKFNGDDKDFCFYDNNIINFSAQKLTEPLNNQWKFWIFVKILKSLKIEIEDNYQFIIGAFEKKINHYLDDSGAVI